MTIGYCINRTKKRENWAFVKLPVALTGFNRHSMETKTVRGSKRWTRRPIGWWQLDSRAVVDNFRNQNRWFFRLKNFHPLKKNLCSEKVSWTKEKKINFTASSTTRHYRRLEAKYRNIRRVKNSKKWSGSWTTDVWSLNIGLSCLKLPNLAIWCV